MVNGLDVFKKHFSSYSENYVFIGGTAASISMEKAGAEFRVTKDLDIVLNIEGIITSLEEVYGIKNGV